MHIDKSMASVAIALKTAPIAHILEATADMAAIPQAPSIFALSLLRSLPARNPRQSCRYDVRRYLMERREV